MFSLCLILAAFVGLLQAKSSTGDSVLVVFDSKLNRSDYSLFFGGLEGACGRDFYDLVIQLSVAEQGYNLTFRAPGDSTPAIKEYDTPNFDHVVVFAPYTKSTL